MIPTFHGLETAKRGLNAQRSALYTTGHNISNANTPGYTRQRVNFTPSNPYPGTGINRPGIPGQLGTGVEAGTIQRVRESFLDVQYRLENNKLGYYSSLNTSLSKMEDIMNEPTDSGLHSVMEKFWSSLQDLTNHTENTGAREVVASTGEMVADTLNYYYNSLVRVKNDIGNEINVKVNDINRMIEQINQLNEQIASIEPHGQLPNDLYDKRDLLVDELSKQVNIKVTNIIPKNYGKNEPSAVGLYQIELVQKDGSPYSPQATLITVDRVSGRTGKNNLVVMDKDNNAESYRSEIATVKVGDITLNNLQFSGELAGLIESYGYSTDSGSKGYYPEMIEKINNLTKAFANEFNAVHKNGYALGATEKSDRDFFEYDEKNPALTIRVNQAIVQDPALIAAGSKSGDSGDNGNAAALAKVKSKNFNDYLTKVDVPAGMNGSIDSYYAGIIGNLGVSSQSVNKDMENSQILLDSVDYNRSSINGVSLDEEMTNLVTFQHAYNASARMITVIDEMIDKIINGMGVVGR
ncbi:flagellar hook-associated protein FlgK [Bacillus kwashiorkori]|uniref:flagellar hook-associated protein FlgK n=1 Tax=Bacillus kwashiorkori TaxID=1522318 RepID=UPI000785B270|nr:flagellar hook-associated protein FlgK [Bacillus kwashiorkori]